MKAPGGLKASHVHVMEVKPPPGVAAAPYPVWRDGVYRVGLGVAALGMTLVLAGGADGRPPWVLWVVALGSAGAAWMLFVWVPAWRYVVLGLTAVGVALMPVAAWPWAAGFYLAALSVMAAKEEHCFHFVGGRWFPWAALVAVGLAVAGVPSPLQVAAWGIATVLLWVLVAERWRLPWLTLTTEASRAAGPPPPGP
jgi:uncharacterized integral membrane protein